ncbi:MAG: hypothetical protein C0500_12690 [Sphingobium sp.]|nr:hypothetical protein [Sphingobium sp.]
MSRGSTGHGGVMRLLARLAREQRGNVLALAAIMLTVTIVIAGSSVDTARLYLVKVRLQQACDSGVLAGRRFMIDSAATTLDTNSSTQATNFFNNNFKAGWLGTSSVTFTPSKTNNNRVSGTASAVVPMSLTKIIGMPNQTINVTCEARYDLADTDIMFVLDTTGSMACLPSEDNATCSASVGTQGTSAYTRPADSALGAASGSVNDSVAGYPGSYGYYVNEKTGSRISALRTAVISFYNTMAANVQPGTNIRYGFVTYTSVVNAGKAIMSINPQYMVGGAGNATTNWTYQSRRVTADYQISATNTTYTGRTSAQCNALIVPRNPATPLTYNTSTQQATESTVSWSSGSGGTCVVTARVYGPTWTYGPTSLNVSSLLTNASVDDPTRVDTGTASWQGCIEERDTTASSTFNINSLPPDLDPDLVPTSDATRWRPAWPQVIYGRNYTGGTYGYSSTANTTSNGDTTSIATALSYFNYNNQQLLKAGWHSCGKPVRRLATMSLTDVTNYVNATDFRPIGGTYHDTGMIWGLRLISPTGIFANDTAAWPGRNPPNRVIVFLTDGAMAPNVSIYGQYGVEYFDRRVTGGTFTSQEAYHNARFLAVCAKAKSMNISIWTVALGLAATPELQQCASSPSQSLSSTSGSDLNDKFQTIAQRVARLRVSQ